MSDLSDQNTLTKQLMEDIRWKQRFANLTKAFSKLEKGLDMFDFENFTAQQAYLTKQYQLSDDEVYLTELENLELRREGLIQRFEYCYELFMNTLRDLMLEQSLTKEDLGGSRTVLQQAFAQGLIQNHDEWRSMVLARNDTSHSYNDELADEITKKIQHVFFPLMKVLFQQLALENDRT